ncbi:MAG: CBS domain-containing protein [Candidatus Altiarchaeia archaeon]
MPTVGEVMTRGVITIGEEESVASAMKTMVERHVSSIIVKKKDDADVYGIVTRKDVIHSVVGRSNDPRDMKVADVMTKPVMTITPSMDVVAAAKLMEKTRVRRFPVVENNVLVGLISNSDIFRAYVMDNIISKAKKN